MHSYLHMPCVLHLVRASLGFLFRLLLQLSCTEANCCVRRQPLKRAHVYDWLDGRTERAEGASCFQQDELSSMEAACAQKQDDPVSIYIYFVK
jgi:hypothetical protein